MSNRTLAVGAVAMVLAAIEAEEKACPIHRHKDWERREKKEEQCTCAHRRTRP
jgi:hypothetical protein